jgi:hypothetical protein
MMDYTKLKKLEFRRKFLKIVGAEIFIDDPATETEVGYIKMKAWKLREDIRIYTSRAMEREIAQIHARQIIDFGATYDVTDSATGQVAFALRRKGLKSALVRDHWDIQDEGGNVIGSVQETSGTLALIRRWIELVPYGDLLGLLFAFIVQTYEIRTKQADGSEALAGTIVHRKNPFVVKMSLDTSLAQAPVQPLIPLAATAMLSIIDAAKNN